MATTSFSAWFHGAPLELNVGETGTFGYWFHGAPTLRADTSGTVLTLQSLQMRARIVMTPTETFQARARILATVVSTLDMRAKVLNSTHQSLDMQARMSRQQGWPIPDGFDPGFALFQPTQLNMRARLTQGSLTSQTFTMRANIRRGGTSLLRLRARIVLAGTISMRAHIKPRRSQIQTTMTYYVARASQSRALMLFYTQGAAAEQTISMRARIVHAQQTRVTGTFIVRQSGSGSSMLSFDFASTQVTLQQLRMRARIAAP